MTRRALAGAVLILTLTGCTSGGDEAGTIDYYGTMREIPGMEGATEASLDDLAEISCHAVEVARENGKTNRQAFNQVADALFDAGMSEADTLRAAAAIVGANCPMDISE